MFLRTWRSCVSFATITKASVTGDYAALWQKINLVPAFRAFSFDRKLYPLQDPYPLEILYVTLSSWRVFLSRHRSVFDSRANVSLLATVSTEKYRFASTFQRYRDAFYVPATWRDSKRVTRMDRRSIEFPDNDSRTFLSRRSRIDAYRRELIYRRRKFWQTVLPALLRIVRSLLTDSTLRNSRPYCKSNDLRENFQVFIQLVFTSRRKRTDDYGI